MKIMNRSEFLKQPNGTIYSKYKLCVFNDLMIKEDSLRNDFIYQQISDAIDCSGSEDFCDKLEESQEIGTELTMNFDCCGRDGCFEENQLFAVWSNEDRLALIKRLEECDPNVRGERETKRN